MILMAQIYSLCTRSFDDICTCTCEFVYMSLWVFT